MGLQKAESSKTWGTGFSISKCTVISPFSVIFLLRGIESSLQHSTETNYVLSMVFLNEATGGEQISSGSNPRPTW